MKIFSDLLEKTFRVSNAYEGLTEGYDRRNNIKLSKM